MAAPEFIYLVKPGVANSLRAPLAGAPGWLSLGWQLADSGDAQWLLEAPAVPAVDVITRDELDPFIGVRDQTGNPITGRRAYFVVDANGDFDDLIIEEN